MALEDNIKTTSKGKGLSKKVGPLDVWQYVAIGTGLGVIYYVYKKNHTEANPEEESKLQKEKELLEEELSATRSGGNPLAGSGSGGGSSNSGPTAAEVAALVPAGPAGAPGAPGAEGEAPQTAKVENYGEVGNTPPTGTQTVAPQKASLSGANAKGEHYTVAVGKNGIIYHDYANGRKVALTASASKAAVAALNAAGLGGSKIKKQAGDTAPANHTKKPKLKAPKSTAFYKTPSEKAKKKAEAKKKAAAAEAEKKKKAQAKRTRKKF